jgi:aspartate oxidase
MLTLEAPPTVPPTVAQQIFVIGSGIAGGMAGLYLAQKLSRVENVRTGPLALATLASILFTVGGAIYLAKHS